MPTLLSSTSTLPHLARQASTIALTSALLEASHSNACASPPSLAISPTVSSAAARLRSTQNTLAPSRANVTAVHLPLPQPGPLEPAPTTIATLSFNLPVISSAPQPCACVPPRSCLQNASSLDLSMASMKCWQQRIPEEFNASSSLRVGTRCYSPRRPGGACRHLAQQADQGGDPLPARRADRHFGAHRHGKGRP